MEFFIGVLFGAGLCLAVCGILWEHALTDGVEKPERPPDKPDRENWVQTRNFLYYDGTVMPNSKEDANEQ